MAKSKEKKKPKLPKPEDLPCTNAILQQVKVRKERVAKAKAAATKDGKFSKYDPKYRVYLKALKRGQRRLKSELLRHRLKEEVKPAEGATEAPKAEGAPAGTEPRP